MTLTVEGADRPRDPQVAETFWPARLRLIVSPRHELAHRAVARRDLGGRTCLLADPEGAFNELVRRWIGDAVRSPRLESAGSIDGVKRGVLGGDAIGVLPDYAVSEELSAGTLIALRTNDPSPQIALCLTTREAPHPGSPLESLTGRIAALLDARLHS
jgi:DNA-binding transcriptional LysR family regulator